MFEFITTEDGSPTVRVLKTEVGSSEAMHSLKGAFSETAYIYGTAIEHCFSNGFPPRILSLGLGLGYVELLTAGLAIRHGLQASLSGESFEILPELSQWFVTWLNQASSTPLNNVYDEILKRTADHLNLKGAEIRSLMKELIETERWRLRAALENESSFAEPFGCICFDAFSSKSTPDLWQEEFLKAFFNRSCAPLAVLSTYACTGQLKRALREHGFTVQIRTGFSSKRDSTFAVKLTPAG